MKMLHDNIENSITGLKRALTKQERQTWEVPGHTASSPYRIRIVRTKEQLESVVAVRCQAYSEKLQALASKVQQPGPLDFTHEPIVLVAENGLTGEAVGTLRVNTGPQILDLLQDVQLPADLVCERVAFVSRMAVIGTVPERQLVRNLLQKAVFQLAVAKQLSRILLLAVHPRERLFYRCGFRDVFADGAPRFPKFLDHFPVKALYADTYSLEREWREENHPLYDFLFRTFHPEIEVFASVSSSTQRSNEPSRSSGRSHSPETFVVN
jgi:hypothetical protein